MMIDRGGEEDEEDWRPLRFWRENHNNNGGLRFTGDSVLLRLNLRYMRVYCSPRSSSISLLNRTTMATMEAAMVVDVVVEAVVTTSMEIEIEIDRWLSHKRYFISR